MTLNPSPQITVVDGAIRATMAPPTRVALVVMATRVGMATKGHGRADLPTTKDGTTSPIRIGTPRQTVTVVLQTTGVRVPMTLVTTTDRAMEVDP